MDNEVPHAVEGEGETPFMVASGMHQTPPGGVETADGL